MQMDTWCVSDLEKVITTHIMENGEFNFALISDLNIKNVNTDLKSRVPLM